MRYQIRQRVFSFGDSFTIKDEYGNERFEVQGKIFSFGSKLRIYDMTGEELVYIEQEVFHLLPKYNIYLRGKYSASIKKELSFFKPRFIIESIMGDYYVEGDIFSHEFQIIKDGREAAYVSKKWFSFGDSYGAEILDSENQELILAMIIVIDMVLYNDKNN